MLGVNNFPRPTEAQTKAVLKEMQSNPSLRWDGQFGFYSNGVCVIEVSWAFDPEETLYRIKFDREGKKDINR